MQLLPPFPVEGTRGPGPRRAQIPALLLAEKGDLFFSAADV